MKILKVSALAMFLAVFSACSNQDKAPATDQPAETPTESSSSGLMDEGVSYDPSKIDANAPVTEIKLKAQGNNMDEMRYDLTEIRVPAGSTVKLKLTNEGTDAAMLHNFVLIKKGTADEVAKESITAGPDNNWVASSGDVLVATKMLDPKAETEITFPAPEKGEYEFICTYPGHYQKMRGKFIVE